MSTDWPYRHAANGAGIHFFGADRLDAEGLAKLHDISPIFAVHAGMPPYAANLCPLSGGV